MDWNVSTREILSVFVRTPVDREVDKIGAYATIVEQGVALPGCAVANYLPAGPLGLDQEFQQLTLGLTHSRFEVLVIAERGYARLCLACAEGPQAVGDFLGRIFRMTRVNADRASVSWKLFDIENRKAMRGENTFCRVQRKIREVFVVYLVELIPLDRSQQVRKLDRDHT